MRILFVAPEPPNEKNRVRLFNHVRAAERFAEVRVMAPTGGTGYVRRSAFRVCATARAAVALARGESMRAAYMRSADFARRLRKLREDEFDLVIFKRKRMGQYRDCFSRNVYSVIDLTDAVSLAELRVAASSARWRRRIISNLDLPGTAREEIRLVTDARFDEVWLASDDDIAFFRRVTNRPLLHARVVPNVVGDDFSQAEAAVLPGPESAAAFVADFRYPTNQASLDWLLGEVWPRVLSLEAEARLEVFGYASGAGVGKAPPAGVVARGFVPSIADALRKSAVVAAPIIAGAGTKNKVLQALALGLPVVATPLGVEGLGEATQLPLVAVCETPQEFARQLVRLRSAPSSERSLHCEAARQLIRESFSLDALSREILAATARAQRAATRESYRRSA